MCVHMCVHICVCAYVCAHVCVHMCVRMCKCAYVCAYMCVRICVCACVCAYMCVCMCVVHMHMCVCHCRNFFTHLHSLYFASATACIHAAYCPSCAIHWWRQYSWLSWRWSKWCSHLLNIRDVIVIKAHCTCTCVFERPKRSLHGSPQFGFCAILWAQPPFQLHWPNLCLLHDLKRHENGTKQIKWFELNVDGAKLR